MNKTSFKFILGFALILMASLGILIYFSAGNGSAKGVTPVENLAGEKTI